LVDAASSVREKLKEVESCKSIDCIRLLMELQYSFPLTLRPFNDIAKNLGYDARDIIVAVRELKDKGFIKRIGYYYNARSSGKFVALVAFKTEHEDELFEKLLGKLEITHAYVRDCDMYNLWVVARANSEEYMVNVVKSISAQYAERFSILKAVRTYRLSVKYDLYRGISRAGYLGEIPLSPPSPEELGYPKLLPLAVRSLPIEERPYAQVAAKLGLTEEYVVNAVKKLLSSGVLADPGAALDGHRIGFKVNVMYTVKAKGENYSRLCSLVSKELREATHIVLRSPYPANSWSYNCFFMVHAVDIDLLHVVDSFLDKLDLVDDYLKIVSIRDLMPGVVR